MSSRRASESNAREFLCVSVQAVQVCFVDTPNNERDLVQQVIAAIVASNCVELVMDCFVALLAEAAKRAMIKHELLKVCKHGMFFGSEAAVPRVAMHKLHARLPSTAVVTA